MDEYFSLDQNFLEEKMNNIKKITTKSINNKQKFKLDFKREVDVYKEINTILSSLDKVYFKMINNAELYAKNVILTGKILKDYDNELSKKINNISGGDNDEYKSKNI